MKLQVFRKDHLLVLLGCCWLATTAQAASAPKIDVTIQLDPAPGAADRIVGQQPGTTGPQAQALLDGATAGVAASLQDAAQTALGKLNISGLMRSNTLAQAIGSTSYFADYGSNMDFFSIGLVNTFGVNNADLSKLAQFKPGLPTGQEKPIGLTWNAGLVGGINLQFLPIPSFGLFDLKKLMLFANASAFNTGTLLNNTKFVYWMAGGYVMYRLIDNFTIIPGGILRWGGLRVGTGLQVQSTTLGWQSPIRPKPSVSNTIGTAPATFDVVSTLDSTLIMDLKLNTYTIPIEVSSNLQLAHFFTIFGGVSMDIYTGDANLSAKSTSKIDGNLNGDSSAPLYTGTGTVTFKQTTPANIGALRLMAGGQFNLGLVGLFCQVNFLYDYTKPQENNAAASSFALASGIRVFF